jgi:hypothetical protein
MSMYEYGIISRGVEAADENVVRKLSRAQDILRTTLPPIVDVNLSSKLEAAVNQIDLALEEIKNPEATRNGWKDARSTLQIVIRQIEVYSRSEIVELISSSNK